MILVEMSLRSIDVEKEALAALIEKGLPPAYYQGALDAIAWIRDGAPPPSARSGQCS